MIIEYNIPSPVDARTLNIFVRALCAYNVLWLRAHPDTPNIFESGVRYQTQPIGVEHFIPIPLIIQAGSGDCDQLASWRAAELRVRKNVKAMPEVKRMGSGLFHVFVRMPNGAAEDISAHLGMPVPQKLAAIGRAMIERKHGKSTAAAVASDWPIW